MFPFIMHYKKCKNIAVVASGSLFIAMLADLFLQRSTQLEKQRNLGQAKNSSVEKPKKSAMLNWGNFSLRDPVVVSGFLEPSACMERVRPRSRETYILWSSVFARIQNPLIFYTDSGRFFQQLSAHRQLLPTLLYTINTSDLQVRVYMH